MNEVALSTALQEEPAADVATKQLLFAPGIYFNLDEEAYHNDPALGSTDIRKLSYSPPDYWFTSPLNVDAPEEEDEKESPARVFGRAVHKFVLEGRDAFEAGYGACEFKGNVKAGIAERAVLKEQGRIPLTAKMYRRILLSGTMIRSNPYLAEAFSGGRSEVSVFWVRDGIRRKARFDYLKIRAIIDLKTVRNRRKVSFKQACRSAIAEWDYPTQADHYREGREHMLALFKNGAVFGDVDRDWLARVVEQKEFAFVFCFWQAEGAPLTWATQLSPGNGVLDVARRTIEVAENNYREFMEMFGPDQPWVVAEPMEELDINEIPTWWRPAQ